MPSALPAAGGELEREIHRDGPKAKGIDSECGRVRAEIRESV